MTGKKKIRYLYLFLIIIFTVVISILFPKNINAGAGPTLEDFWNGRATWQFRNKMTVDNADIWQDGYSSSPWHIFGYRIGSQIVVKDGIWYLFSRKVFWGDTHCPPYDNMGSEVRKSTDQGITWSRPVEVIAPTRGTPWECGAVDGGAYYSSISDKWIYLFQCADSTGMWRGCYAERQGGNPMGAFTIRTQPVISPGQLWSRICSNPNSDCRRLEPNNDIRDEGTFDIFAYLNGYYYVSFHGYPYNGTGLGFRGIAKTTDFVNWIAGDKNQSVPDDAIFDKYDAVNWRENWIDGKPIGFGAGRVISENGYYYLFAEGADKDLNCTDGQNWDWGLFRSKDLTSSIWEQYPQGNPFIYSSKVLENNGKSLGCNLLYAGIIRDTSTNKYYLHISRSSTDSGVDGIYIYELVSNNNLLKNADLWMCRSEPDWKKITPDTNMTVYRNPKAASDGNCYISSDCSNSSCRSLQGIYQDISLTDPEILQVSYGGKFSVSSGTGIVLPQLIELDSNSHEIRRHNTSVNLDSSYKNYENEIVLDNATQKLRFAVYLNSSQPVNMDEMFVRPAKNISLTLNPSFVPAPSLIPSSTPTPTITFTPTPDPNITPNPTINPNCSPLNYGCGPGVPPCCSSLSCHPPPPINAKNFKLTGTCQISTLVGDFNHDGIVNIYDYNLLITDFGKTGSPGWIPSDINKDGKVDIFDYNILVQNFGH